MVGTAKVALAAVTCLLLMSAGGGILLVPALAPLHLWAARRSGPRGRLLWSVPVGLGTGATAWAGVYTAVGELRPFIWAVPLLFGLGAAAAFWWVVAR